MSNPFTAPEYGQQSTMGRSRVRLKRVGILSVAIFGAAAGAIMGLLVGGFTFLISLVGLGIGNVGGPGGGGGGGGAIVGMGIGILVFAPLLYGFLGFIGGLLNALIYNIIAGMTGGVELEFGQD